MKTYRFSFDIEPSRRLRDAVNDKQNLSIEKESTLKDIGGYLAWDRICAIMDRIDDIITHLNSLELGNDKNRSAFDFYEFVSCAAVLIDCMEFCSIHLLSCLGLSLFFKSSKKVVRFAKHFANRGIMRHRVAFLAGFIYYRGRRKEY